MNIALKIPLQTTADQLIEGCIKEDRAAQKRLYELFYGKMMGVSMRYAIDADEAKDIVNAGFLKVFKNIHKFKPTHSLESWIRRIMINTAIDHYRKNKKHRNKLDITEVYDYSENESISAQLSANEILKLVQKLSPAYRTVFCLYVIDGFNHREIGEKLGISEGTSKSNLAKGRAKLQKMVKDLQIL